MTAETAREIIKQALADETWEAPAPEDDDQALVDAQSIVKMAEDAWEQNIRGPEVEAILKIAASDENGDKPTASKAKPKPKAAAAKKPGRPSPKAKPEPEPEADSRASEEPWEDYDKDKVPDIVEGVEVWTEEENHDRIMHVYIYELANKNRKNIIAACEAGLPEELLPVAEEVTPEPEAEPEEETVVETPEEWDEEPFESYNTLKMAEIREALQEFFENEDYSEEDKLNTLNHVAHYETANKNRSGLISYLEGIRSAYKEVQGVDAEGTAEEEGEAEDAAAPEADEAATTRPARRKSAGKEDRSSEEEGDGSVQVSYAVKAVVGEETLHYVYDGKHAVAGAVLDLIEFGATSISVDAS